MSSADEIKIKKFLDLYDIKADVSVGAYTIRFDNLNQKDYNRFIDKGLDDLIFEELGYIMGTNKRNGDTLEYWYKEGKE